VVGGEEGSTMSYLQLARRHRARLLRRAMLRPEAYLAAALAEWPDVDLAYL
jgi:hypothetical protein